MDDNNDQKKKTDWSLTNSIRRTTAPPEREENEQRAVSRSGLQPGGHSSVPSAPAVALPDTSASRGIVMQWKENKLGRKAALKALEAQYNGQLDALTHSISKAVQVQKARADVVASEYLRELDARHIAMMAELGLRNKDTRERTLITLTDQTAARLAEVQSKDWPEELIADVMNNLFTLRRRVVAEMMKELGGEYTDD